MLDYESYPDVIIMEGGATSLALVRCLASVGIFPTVAIFKRAGICQHSKLCKTIHCDIPFSRQDELAHWLLRLLGDGGPKKTALLPASDQSRLFVARNKNILKEPFVTWDVPYDNIVQLVNKDEMSSLAATNGISVPPEFSMMSTSSLSNWANRH